MTTRGQLAGPPGAGEGGIVSEFLRRADERPAAAALVFTRTGVRNSNTADSVTFRELGERAERFAAGLRATGLGPGDRLILATPLSVDFYALSLAVVGSGLTLVLIDGRMDRRRLLAALRAARARAIVSTTAALRRWPLVSALWRLRRFASDGTGPGVRALSELESTGRLSLGDRPLEDVAAISFTSGTSGRAKGVKRSYAIFQAQHESLSRHLPFRPGDVDMPAFPAVVLHNLCCGVTTVLPPVDLREPGAADPAAVAAAAREHDVTTLSGAPAYIGRLVEHLLASGERLPRVRRVVVGGAPVTRRLSARVAEAFPEADGRVVYGSTEAEPIAHVSMSELRESEGEGFLVGSRVPELEVALVDLPERLDKPVGADELSARAAAVGEVIARGAGVSRDYAGDPDAVALNKVREPDGGVWHRTGDIGRLDDQGRLWLLGRRGETVTHRGRVLHPLAVEAGVLDVPGVQAAGLVAHAGEPEGELAVAVDKQSRLDEIQSRLDADGLGTLPIRLLEALPSDARHNSKVDRIALAKLLEDER